MVYLVSICKLQMYRCQGAMLKHHSQPYSMTKTCTQISQKHTQSTYFLSSAKINELHAPYNGVSLLSTCSGISADTLSF